MPYFPLCGVVAGEPQNMFGLKPYHYCLIFTASVLSLSGILVASGMKGTEKERGRETETERGTEIDGPLVEGRGLLTSGTDDAPGLIHLPIGHHGDG